ncbi:MAG: S9 family peptidase [Woeseia sp.]
MQKYFLSVLAVLSGLSLAAGSTGPAHAESANAAPPVVIDDFGKLKSVGEPQLSTDGRQVAYVLEGRIYVVPVGGGDSRPVTTGGSSASEPRWSRDGNVLYFLSDRTGTSQLWKLPLDSFGEAVQLTHLEQGVDTLQFSPDESRLLLSFDDEAAKGADKKDAGDAAVKEPWVITRQQFKEDEGDGYQTEWPSYHLYVYDIATEKLERVTTGRYTEGEAAWSADGLQLVFVSNREDDPDLGYESDLWTVSAGAAGDSRPLARLTNDKRVKSSPKWSPDGKSIAYLSAEDGVYGIHQLALMSATGGEAKYLTAELDRWVASFEFSEDGRWIYFLFDNHGGRHLARVRLRDGVIERLIEGERNVSAFDIDSSGRAVARIQNMNDAAELYRSNNGRIDRLTDVNKEYFAARTTGSKEKVSYTVADGTVVEAFVTRPPGFEPGRRYPAILKIHGGPVGQFSYGYDFGSQFFAANGYLVVEPNPRGSTGRGQAFVRAIYQTWGITDYPDVIGAIDRVIELGYADPEKLAVTGYSYGGYMTNVVITESDRFKAAASGAGHSMIAANYGHDIYQKWYNWELGLPQHNRDKYDRLSPLMRAGRVVTPTIFLGGREDWNVPILNAELFYQTLRHRGIDTQLVVYPNSHHGGWDQKYSKDYLERIVAWFDHHIKE